MRVPGLKILRRGLRPLARVLFPGAVVLGYHRVATTDWDPLGLAVSPDHFKAQVEVLRNSRDVARLGDLAARHAAGERLDPYAALTFDDGYGDFADEVLPILEALEVPATVFVATGFIGRSFWWDEVAALLKPKDEDTAALEISLDGDEPWRFGALNRRDQRAAAARALCTRLACGSEEEIGSVIGQLRAWAGAGEESQPDGAAMSRIKLEALAQHPLVEIGAHTVSHGCLALLVPEAQRAEIQQSKKNLESLAGTAVSVFSYPNGSYSTETPELVEALGFSCACTSMEGVFSSRTDRYRIPRNWAPDAEGPEFRHWLGDWAKGVR
jgi:peptidoglycan/xylan/chitin deacetylase (PgdA/CDA1 family)